MTSRDMTTVVEILELFTEEDFNKLYRLSPKFRQVCREMRVIGQKKTPDAVRSGRRI